jgi:hypothetical protein
VPNAASYHHATTLAERRCDADQALKVLAPASQSQNMKPHQGAKLLIERRLAP